MLNSSSTPIVEGITDASITEDYHNLSHHGKSEEKLAQLRALDMQHMKMLHHLYGGLKSVKEDQETLLDRTHAKCRDCSNTIVIVVAQTKRPRHTDQAAHAKSRGIHTQGMLVQKINACVHGPGDILQCKPIATKAKRRIARHACAMFSFQGDELLLVSSQGLQLLLTQLQLMLHLGLLRPSQTACDPLLQGVDPCLRLCQLLRHAWRQVGSIGETRRAACLVGEAGAFAKLPAVRGV